MLESKEYDYSSVEGDEEEAFLGNNGFDGAEMRSLSMTSSKFSWLLFATVTVTSLLAGGAFGYNFRQVTPAKGLTFADTSHLKLCKKSLLKHFVSG